jgi:hypothetical protein
MIVLGNCTPCNKTLAIAGNKKRGRATIKRYISTLIELNLISRSFPTGRKHMLHVTEFGQEMYKKRKHNPANIAAKNKIEPLSKIKEISIPLHNNYNHVDSEYVAHKPVFRKIDGLILRRMLKNCAISVSRSIQLEHEIKWAIEYGSLMCTKVTEKYHKISDSVKIAVWLVRAGRWRTPHGFGEWVKNKQIYERAIAMNDSEKNWKTCEGKNCGHSGDDVKTILMDRVGLKTFCSNCYVKNIRYEHKKIKEMLAREMRIEYKSCTGKELSLEDFFIFTHGLYLNRKFDVNLILLAIKLYPSLSALLFIEWPAFTCTEFGGMIKVDAMLKEYFRFYRKNG